MVMGMVINTTTLAVTPDLLELLAEIEEFRGAWRALGTLAPERLTTLQRVATIESVGSSTRIEGSLLSDQAVAALLSKLDAANFASRDEQEVAGYAATMEMVFASWQEIALTENHIRQLHRDVLRFSEKDVRHRGEYKTQANHVAAFDEAGDEIGIVFATASPFDTPRRMTELVAWTRETLETRSLHPLLAIAVFLVVFLEIHPFQDGNGRLSRILTTLLLLRAGYAYVPYSSLESVVEANKEAYYRALRQTQATVSTESPNWQPWVGFFLRAMQQQKRRLEVKLEREHLLLAHMPALSLNILEHVRQHGRATLRELAATTGANRNTVKLHLRQLAERRQIALYGKGRGAWYSLALPN